MLEGEERIGALKLNPNHHLVSKASLFENLSIDSRYDFYALIFAPAFGLEGLDFTSTGSRFFRTFRINVAM